MLLRKFCPWKNFLGVCLNVYKRYARETGVILGYKPFTNNLYQRQHEGERAAIDGRIIDYTLHPIRIRFRIHGSTRKRARDVKLRPKFPAVY